MSHQDLSDLHEDMGGNTKFAQLCLQGNLSDLERHYTSRREDLNVRNDSGATPLYSACERGHRDVVEFLLRIAGVDVNQANHEGFSPLYAACQNGHTEVVKLLLRRKDLRVNERLEDGGTPLWIASQNGHLEVVQAILESSRNVDTLAKRTNAFGQPDAVEIALWAAEVNFLWPEVPRDNVQRRQTNCPKIVQLIRAYQRRVEAASSEVMGLSGKIIDLSTPFAPCENVTFSCSCKVNPDPDPQSQQETAS